MAVPPFSPTKRFNARAHKFSSRHSFKYSINMKILRRMAQAYNNIVRNNTGYSSKNYFLVWVTNIGLFLLLVAGIVLLVDVFYDGTVTTDLSGMAQFVGAVAGVFASAGVTKAWSEKFEHHDKPESES